MKHMNYKALFIAVIFLSAFISGFYGVLQYMAIITLSISLYVALLGKNIKSWRLPTAMNLLSVILGCILLWEGCRFPPLGKSICWAIGLLMLYASSYKNLEKHPGHNISKSLIYTLCFVGLSLLITGFNPFVGMKYAVKSHYNDYAYSRRGVYLIKEDSLWGLRDRFSIIEKPQFYSIEILNQSKPFVAVSTSERVGVYNLETHDFDIIPTPRCSKIAQVSDTTYKMLDKSGNPYRLIIIPRFWWKNLPEQQLKNRSIVDDVGNISKDFIRDIAEEFKPDLENAGEDFTYMYKQCETSYNVLGKIIRSSGCANTPKNNLQWYEVVNEIIEETELSRDSLMTDMYKIVKWYDGRSQYDSNHAAYMKQVLSHFEEMEQFSQYLKHHPSQYREYELWSEIQAQTIDKYIDRVYKNNHYSSLPVDVSGGIVNHLKEVTELLTIQNSLLSGEDVYISHTFTQTVDSDEEETEKKYNEWLEERRKFASTLSLDQQRKYDYITAQMMSSLDIQMSCE